MVTTIKEKISDGLVEEFYNNGQLKRRGNRKTEKKTVSGKLSMNTVSCHKEEDL